MTDRFSPNQNKLKKAIDDLVSNLSGNEDLFVDAYSEAAHLDSKSKPKSIEDAKRELKGILISPGVPFIFFDAVTNLIRRLPLPSRNMYIDMARIETKIGYEWLQPNTNGTWQVVWQLEPEEETGYQDIALDWYSPPELNDAPIVPIAIIDYVSGSVSLMRGKLILPSLSLLFIALEAALWDALAQNGISRVNERITYKATQWEFKKSGGKLIFTISGSDKDLNGLDAAIGTYPVTGFLTSRVSGFENSKAILKVEIEEKIWGYFASGIEEKKEFSSEKGLSEAVQRARKLTIMKTVAAQLDDTIIRMRNNLIHLSLDGKFDPQIPIPGGGYLTDHEELRRETRIASSLVRLVVELINDIYSKP